jgi:hypothetical protein
LILSCAARSFPTFQIMYPILLEVAQSVFPQWAHFLGPANLSLLFSFLLLPPVNHASTACCCLLPLLRPAATIVLCTAPLRSSCSPIFSRSLHRLTLPHLDIFSTTTPPPCRCHGSREIPIQPQATEVTRRRLPRRPSQRRSPPSYLPANPLASHSKRVDQATERRPKYSSPPYELITSVLNEPP